MWKGSTFFTLQWPFGIHWVFSLCVIRRGFSHMGLQRYIMCFIGWIDSFLNVKPMSLSGTIFQESWQLLNDSIFWKLLCSRQFDGWFRNLSINWQSGYFAFYRIVKEICHFSKWIYHHVRKEGKWYFPKEYGQKDIDGLKYWRSLKMMKMSKKLENNIPRCFQKITSTFFLILSNFAEQHWICICLVIQWKGFCKSIMNFFIIVKHPLRPFKTSSTPLRCKYGKTLSWISW